MSERMREASMRIIYRLASGPISRQRIWLSYECPQGGKGSVPLFARQSNRLLCTSSHCLRKLLIINNNSPGYTTAHVLEERRSSLS